MAKKKEPRTLYCALCSLAVDDPRSQNVAMRVEGWVTVRGGGGINHLRYQQRTGEVAHLTCLDEQQVPARYKMDQLWD